MSTGACMIWDFMITDTCLAPPPTVRFLCPLSWHAIALRLTEVMGGGSIPVILIDHYILPFEDTIDWDAFSIRLPEHQLSNLPVRPHPCTAG